MPLCPECRDCRYARIAIKAPSCIKHRAAFLRRLPRSSVSRRLRRRRGGWRACSAVGEATPTTPAPARRAPWPAPRPSSDGPAPSCSLPPLSLHSSRPAGEKSDEDADALRHRHRRQRISLRRYHGGHGMQRIARPDVPT